jgi:hypothetical protein
MNHASAKRPRRARYMAAGGNKRIPVAEGVFAHRRTTIVRARLPKCRETIG